MNAGLVPNWHLNLQSVIENEILIQLYIVLTTFHVSSFRIKYIAKTPHNFPFNKSPMKKVSLASFLIMIPSFKNH